MASFATRSGSVGDDIALSPAALDGCALEVSSADDFVQDAAGARARARTIASVREVRRLGIGDLSGKKGCVEGRGPSSTARRALEGSSLSFVPDDDYGEKLTLPHR